jgi:hypothetical protein
VTRPRSGPLFFALAVARVAWLWTTLRYRVGEVRNFCRHPFHLRIGASEGPGLKVVLYGVPYGDWNAMLANADFWRSLRVVSEVWRIPAVRFLAPRCAADTVLIPMKTAHAAAVPRGMPGLFTDKRTLSVLDNKRSFQAFIESNGLTDYCPDYFNRPEDARFPCIVKRLDLSGSIGVVIVESPRHLQEVLQSPVFAGRPYLLQALVPGDVEFASFCVCDGGRILWHWTFASAMPGRSVIKTEDNDKDRRNVEWPPGVQRQLETVLAPLDYRGPCIFNYKITEDGRVQIFEINPRFGGSLLQPRQTDRLREAIGCILTRAVHTDVAKPSYSDSTASTAH